MRAISEHCFSMKKLHLKHCSRITDVGVRLIGTGCKEIQLIDIGGLHLITDGMNRDFGLEGIQAFAASARTVQT